MTASNPTYVIVMNGSIAEGDRLFVVTNDNPDGVNVTNGTPCDIEVSTIIVSQGLDVSPWVFLVFVRPLLSW